MAIDRLQEKIRKLKCPIVVDFTAEKSHIPQHILLQEHDFLHGYGRFCIELLEALSGKIPAARFSFGQFAALGTEGLVLLGRLLNRSEELGYYVIMDVPEGLSAFATQNMCNYLNASESGLYFDGLLTAAYIGTDAIKPYVAAMKESNKDLFVMVRSANKTAPELQDLLTGGRLVHMSLADQLNRIGAPLIGKCGYSRIAAVGAASSADSLRNLRTKYKNLFLLLDGGDYPNANAKNCSFAFDALGHGAAACMGLSITAAWIEEGTEGENYLDSACAAVERLKKNLLRYITVL